MISEPLKGEPLTILLVEDDAAHAELIARCFEQHQVANRLYHVSNGEDAMDFLYQRDRYADVQCSPRPHLVLLDLRLPGTSGLEVLGFIKADSGLRSIPVVVVTTSDEQADMADAYQQHVNSYLVKPLSFDKFSQLMRDLGFYWLGWNRRPW